MRRCSQAQYFSRNRKARREKMLQRMARMRAARERKRLANPTPREPKLERYFPFEFGIREKRTGEVAFVDLRSARDVARRVGALTRYLTAIGQL